MEVATKKRTTNFTASEEELLISLVKKYKSVLECLKTDAVNAKYVYTKSNSIIVFLTFYVFTRVVYYLL